MCALDIVTVESFVLCTCKAQVLYKKDMCALDILTVENFVLHTYKARVLYAIQICVHWLFSISRIH